MKMSFNLIVWQYRFKFFLYLCPVPDSLVFNLRRGNWLLKNRSNREWVILKIIVPVNISRIILQSSGNIVSAVKDNQLVDIKPVMIPVSGKVLQYNCKPNLRSFSSAVWSVGVTHLFLSPSTSGTCGNPCQIKKPTDIFQNNYAFRKSIRSPRIIK